MHLYASISISIYIDIDIYKPPEVFLCSMLEPVFHFLKDKKEEYLAAETLYIFLYVL